MYLTTKNFFKLIKQHKRCSIVLSQNQIAMIHFRNLFYQRAQNRVLDQQKQLNLSLLRDRKTI